ncbi:agmatine deiminase family protein [Candidatus Venteria ishoeyi]|uniref:Agmatine deiminase n=1 Tax=Candidatus Venteria ishoeyi TaxID=1899563 RepID=A0A1H6F461_9GAMM|nr:agmatine deiminase family protein [Candidatus Venteria ishoeyi]SEH04353.1 Agmatine deiminase [Candidatus Venteria ishoeyi]
MMSRHLPAEWEPQTAILLTWPHAQGDWGTQLDAVEHTLLQACLHISKHQSLIIACLDVAHRQTLQQKLNTSGIPTSAYQLYIAPSNDSWARDHSLISIYSNQQRVLLDFQFNGWGNKYPATCDNQISLQLHQQGAFTENGIDSPLQSKDFILEGGSIDSDGCGTLLTTRECLLAPTRNAGWTQAAIEAYLKKTLGVQRILWLEHGGIAGDDTDSHIDMLARFCNAHTIAYSICEDPQDSHYQPLQQMHEELTQFRQSNGEAYQLIPLPLPQALYNQEGQRLPASYANFLIINTAVLLPVYGDPADKIAHQRLSLAFPERKIIDIHCRALIEQYGSLHCMAMQLPCGKEV